nr:PREDICTED: proSAAS isoform X2 [Latimeria chalumnae]|eukprot:XP_006008597.1 PREDICTED: proSAAS isoform X2 [Latimeria chalumnae]
MMAYPSPDQLRNEVYYNPELSDTMLARLASLQQDEKLAQALERMGFGGKELGLERAPPSGQDQDERLSQALQQLMEDGRRRDQEALYLANLLQLWNEANQGKGYPERAGGLPTRTMAKAENDFQSPYADYDETGLMTNMVRPPKSRNQVNAQAVQALLNRYQQEGMYDGPPSHLTLEGPNEEEGDVDEEVLRYLVGRILASMGDSGHQHLAKRDLASTTAHQDSYPVLRRARRSVDEDLPDQTNLLRVKRLGMEQDGGTEGSDFLGDPDPAYKLKGGLQRAKRIDEQLDGLAAPIRRKRHAGYDEAEFAERVLKYLPD